MSSKVKGIATYTIALQHFRITQSIQDARMVLVEYHTPVLFHAAPSNIDKLDQLQRSFLHELGIEEAVAFLDFNFPPLSIRRNIGMLGFLHKRVLGRAHPCFSALFPFATNHGNGHSKSLATHAGNFQELLLKRSLFALVRVYNQLPQYVIDLDDISLFQSALTTFAKNECNNGRQYWQHTFDPASNVDDQMA